MTHPFNAYDQRFAANMAAFRREIAEMEKTLASAALSPDEFTPAIEDLERRLALHREKIETLKDAPAMKYALESLPELIGADDFADLCELMGMTDWTRQEIPTGPEFARRVRQRAFKIKHDRESELRRGGSHL